MLGRALLVPAVAAILSGCATESKVSDRPADWASGDPLVAMDGWRYHSADEGQTLYDPGSGPVPASCVAYQDAKQMSRDRCAVGGPKEGWDEEGARVTRGPWTVEATWDGDGEDLVATERDTTRRTVVGFDAAGRPAYYWDGLEREGPMAVE